MNLQDLDLAERPRNCLAHAKISSVKQLLNYTRQDLLGITNLGQKSLEQIEHALSQHGLMLKKHDLLGALQTVLCERGYQYEPKELETFVYSTKTRKATMGGNR